MQFDIFAEKIEYISQEQSRLKISQALARLFEDFSPEEAQAAAYILLGDVDSSYKGKRFNLAEKQIGNFLQTYIQNKSDDNLAKTFWESYKEIGDLGEAFKYFVEKNNILNNATQLSFLAVYDLLKNLSEVSGNGSIEIKKNAFLHLLNDLSVLGQKYSIRIVSGNLRLGVSTMSLLDAFNVLIQGNKQTKNLIEANYNVCADVGRIIFILKTEGIDGLKNPHPVPGVPVCPAAAERVENLGEILTRMVRFVVQPKLDGLRVQIHRFEKQDQVIVMLFSRNMLDISESFPEVVDIIKSKFTGEFVVEGELIAFDPQTKKNLSFQETVQRRRKYNISEFLESMPIRVYLFDILWFEQKNLINEPYFSRREYLESHFAGKSEDIFVISESLLDLSGVLEGDAAIVQAHDFLETYFNEMRFEGFEGFIAKNYESNYQAGKRGFSWIKVKQLETSRLGDTIDAVVIGCYLGKGRRASLGVGALLMAVYDEKSSMFQTIAKVGSGLSDEELIAISESFSKKQISEMPLNYDVNKNLYPDFWVLPEVVLELEADEITFSEIHSAGHDLVGQQNRGLALRFPRVKSIRTDKSVDQATTVSEVLRLAKLTE